MSILIDVPKDLFGMFVADLRLTLAILALVAATAALRVAGIGNAGAGAILLLGCLVLVLASVIQAARRGG